MRSLSDIRQRKRHARQGGFSLVEVLIALIILSVGMLGIAVLYVQSMQAGRTSMFRHHAITLAGDVADRIRANPTAGDTYTGAAASAPGCMTANCTVDEMAANDILLWQEEAANSMPNGAVTVARDGATPPNYTITVSWDEPGEDPASPLEYTITIPVRNL